MTESKRVIPSGRFKGRKIELASTKGIECFRDLADQFMSVIFDLEAGDYLITDESSLADFVGVDDLNLDDILSKIDDLYGIDVSGVERGNLVGIFSKIRGTG